MCMRRRLTPHRFFESDDNDEKKDSRKRKHTTMSKMNETECVSSEDEPRLMQNTRGHSPSSSSSSYSLEFNTRRLPGGKQSSGQKETTTRDYVEDLITSTKPTRVALDNARGAMLFAAEAERSLRETNNALLDHHRVCNSSCMNVPLNSDHERAAMLSEVLRNIRENEGPAGRAIEMYNAKRRRDLDDFEWAPDDPRNKMVLYDPVTDDQVKRRKLPRHDNPRRNRLPRWHCGAGGGTQMMLDNYQDSMKKLEVPKTLITDPITDSGPLGLVIEKVENRPPRITRLTGRTEFWIEQGMMEGCIILAINGERVKNRARMCHLLHNLRPITFEFIHPDWAKHAHPDEVNISEWLTAALKPKSNLSLVPFDGRVKPETAPAAMTPVAPAKEGPGPPPKAPGSPPKAPVAKMANAVPSTAAKAVVTPVAPKVATSKVVADLKRMRVLAPVTETPDCEVPSCTARAIGRTADEVPTRCRKHGGGSCCNIKACRNAVAGKVFDADALGDLGLRCAKHNAEPLCVATSCKEPSGVVTSSWDSYGPPGPRCMAHSGEDHNVNDLPDRSGDRSDGDEAAAKVNSGGTNWGNTFMKLFDATEIPLNKDRSKRTGKPASGNNTRRLSLTAQNAAPKRKARRKA